MDASKVFYESLEKEFLSWAQSMEDIRAAFVVGSRARKNHPADEWSDMDIIFYTSNPKKYLSTSQWITKLGPLSTSFVYETAGGEPECLTLFQGGWQVDFVILPLENLNYMVEKRIVPQNFYKGVRVLMDKDQIANFIMPADFTHLCGNNVTEVSFNQTVNMFWFIILYIAKQILRNELWVVKDRDSDLKRIMLQMVEWHEKMKHGETYDTWHAGRFINEWADKDTFNQLQETFAHYDRKDSLRALETSIKLFQKLSHELANHEKYSYPVQLEETILDWLEENKLIL